MTTVTKRPVSWQFALLACVLWLVAMGAFHAATYTTEIGTKGGNHFEVACPAGEVMVGIDYRSETYLTAIAGYCKAVDASGKVTGKLFGTNGYGGDVTKGRPRAPIYCRQDMVITKLAVEIDHGHVVRLVEVFCSPSVGSGQGFYVGTTQLQKQAPDQGEYNKETEDCRFGVGFTGAATPDGRVQRLGLKCEPIGKAAPLPINNDDGNGNNGNGGGGDQAVSPGGTTVDKQDNGDESDDNVAGFVDPGGTVIVTTCQGNGFCKISAPVAGFVWHEDIGR